MAKARFIGLILAVLMGATALCKAQSTPYFIVNAGYEYHQGNYGVLGASLFLVQHNDNILHFSLNGNMAYFKQHFVLIPEGEIAYSFTGKKHRPYQDVKASFYKLSIAANPYSIKPKIGITLLSLWDFYVGYGFEIKNHPYTDFQGVVIGTQFHIPILGSSKKK